MLVQLSCPCEHEKPKWLDSVNYHAGWQVKITLSCEYDDTCTL